MSCLHLTSQVERWHCLRGRGAKRYWSGWCSCIELELSSGLFDHVIDLQDWKLSSMKTKSLVETWFKSCGTFWHWILTVEFWQHPSSMPYPEPIYLRLSFRISTLLHPLSMPNSLWPQTKKDLKTSREGDWSFSRKPLFQRMNFTPKRKNIGAT